MIFNMTGGGAPLNFKVVGNPQPSNPSENTIWVDTDVAITGWHFSSDQPGNISEGEMWFLAGASGVVSFNALKKNNIQVYPNSAKQYINGSLANKQAKIFKNGAWVEWWDGYLYKYGDKYVHITGGWNARGWKYDSGCDSVAPTINDYGTNIGVDCGKGRYATGVYEVVNDIDVTNYTKLKINIITKSVSTPTDNEMHLRFALALFANKNASTAESQIIAKLPFYSAHEGENEIDISNISGKVGIGIFCYCSNSELSYVGYDYIMLE